MNDLKKKIYVYISLIPHCNSVFWNLVGFLGFVFIRVVVDWVLVVCFCCLVGFGFDPALHKSCFH